MKRQVGMVCLLAIAGSLNLYSETGYEQTYVRKHQDLRGVAVPTEVVRPKLRAAPEDLKIDVLLSVDSKGKVIRAKVLRSTDVRHNTEVVRVVKRWRFTPAQIDGEAVSSKVRIPFVGKEITDEVALK